MTKGAASAGPEPHPSGLGPALPGLAGVRRLLDRTSTVARLADVLRARIIEGGLPPGTQLAEKAVADALGVSRNTLREAFRVLAHEQLVIHEPHRGVFVRTLDADDVRDIYTTRRMVECAAVRAEGASPEIVAEIRAVVDGAEIAAAEGRWSDVSTADLRFHSAIVALAGSRRLNDLMGRILAELRLVFHVMNDPRGLHEPYVRRNSEIAALIEAGRTDDAADELRDYLDDAERRLLAGLSTVR